MHACGSDDMVGLERSASLEHGRCSRKISRVEPRDTFVANVGCGRLGPLVMLGDCSPDSAVLQIGLTSMHDQWIATLIASQVAAMPTCAQLSSGRGSRD